MVTIDNMRLCRNQVENVRAFFTLSINSIEICDCMLLGKPQTPIDQLVVSFPGKYVGEQKNKWKPLVIVHSDALLSQITLAAQDAYAASVDPFVERLAKRLISYEYET